MESDIGFQAALEEARKGANEGGVPIGACLVSADGKILVCRLASLTENHRLMYGQFRDKDITCVCKKVLPQFT